MSNFEHRMKALRTNGPRIKVPENPPDPVYSRPPAEPTGDIYDYPNPGRQLTITGLDKGEVSTILKNLNSQTSKEEMSLWENLFSKIGLPKLNNLQIAIIFSILLPGYETADAKDNIRKALESGMLNIEISEVFKMVETVSEIDYMFYLNEGNEAAEPNYMFGQKDSNIMAWCVYHEARGENEEGQLGVMLTALNKMESKNYAKSLGGVVFKKFAFSWALVKQKLNTIVENTDTKIVTTNGKEIKTIQKEKFEPNTISKIIGNTVKYINENTTIADSKTKIIKRLNEIRKTKDKPRLTEAEFTKFILYHKQGMLENKFYLSFVKTANTFRRIAYLESLFVEKDSRIQEFGSHLFYPDIAPPMNWILPKNYAESVNKSAMSQEQKKIVWSGK